MLEEKDIKKLKEILATKEDLKAFATKEDLKAFATKEDLKAFATKNDFKDLKSDFKNLKLDLISAMEKVFPTKVYLSKELDSIREDFSDLQTSVDAYAKKADTYFQEMLMLSMKIDRHEQWLHKIAEKVGVTLEY